LNSSPDSFDPADTRHAGTMTVRSSLNFYTDALLDRLVHNAYRIELRGESLRSRARKPPPA